MAGLDGYDQWKTASPYDDEPDWVEEAEDWMRRNDELQQADPDEPLTEAYWIIKGLLEYQ